MAIHFFTEGIAFKLPHKRIIKSWINQVILNEERKLGDLNFIFSSDQYVLEINRKYLQHDYFTDIITFNYNQNLVIQGDIFISINTVRENAKTFNVSFEHELFRVIVHGVLHLIGFDDINETLKKQMTAKEDEYLDLLYSKFLTK